MRLRAVKSHARGWGRALNDQTPLCGCHMGQGYPDIFPQSLLELERMPRVCWLHTQPSNHVKFHKLPWLNGHLVGTFKSPRRDLQLVRALLPFILSIIPSHRRGNRAIRLHCKLASTWDPWYTHRVGEKHQLNEALREWTPVIRTKYSITAFSEEITFNPTSVSSQQQNVVQSNILHYRQSLTIVSIKLKKEKREWLKLFLDCSSY